MKKLLIFLLIASVLQCGMHVHNTLNEPILFEYTWYKDGKPHTSSPMIVQPGAFESAYEGDGFPKYHYTIYTVQGAIKAVAGRQYIEELKKGHIPKLPDPKSGKIPSVDAPYWQPAKQADFDGRYDNRAIKVFRKSDGSVDFEDRVQA